MYKIQISELWNLNRQFHTIIDYSFSFRFERSLRETLQVEPKSTELNTVQFSLYFAYISTENAPEKDQELRIYFFIAKQSSSF